MQEELRNAEVGESNMQWAEVLSKLVLKTPSLVCQYDIYLVVDTCKGIVYRISRTKMNIKYASCDTRQYDTSQLYCMEQQKNIMVLVKFEVLAQLPVLDW